MDAIKCYSLSEKLLPYVFPEILLLTCNVKNTCIHWDVNIYLIHEFSFTCNVADS